MSRSSAADPPPVAGEPVDDACVIVGQPAVGEAHHVEAVDGCFGVSPPIGLECGPTIIERSPVGFENEAPLRDQGVDDRP